MNSNLFLDFLYWIIIHFSAAPRKIIVRRQAAAAKPAEDAADQKVAATPEGDKKTEGTEELDERFWSSRFFKLFGQLFHFKIYGARLPKN